MIDEFNKALESDKTEEAKKAVAEKFNDELKELTPEDLEGVAGGMNYNVRDQRGLTENNWDNTLNVH